MSHFTKLDKAKIVSLEAFIAACKELGFDEATRDTRIKDYYGKEIDVNVACKSAKSKYSIALQKNEQGQYDMIADWWGIRLGLPEQCQSQGITDDSSLQDALLRHTAKQTIIQKYKRDGWRAEVSEDENHNIKLRLLRA